MNKPYASLAVPALLLMILLNSCAESGKILMSPVPYAQSSYHIQPTQSDSIQSANYLSLAGSFNALGNNLEDNAQLVQFKFHHAGKAGRFQYFGGLQLNAGAYNFNENPGYYDSGWVNYPARRSNFVWAGALSGGMTYALPVSSNFEWRILGLEGSLGLEGGRYVNFRKDTPDNLFEYVDRDQLQPMVFLSTEMVFRRKKSGTKIGYQFAVGTNFKQMPYDYYYSGSSQWNTEMSIPAVVRNTLHITKDPISFHFQIFGSRYLLGLNTGITYRLSKLVE